MTPRVNSLHLHAFFFFGVKTVKACVCKCKLSPVQFLKKRKSSNHQNSPRQHPRLLRFPFLISLALNLARFILRFDPSNSVTFLSGVGYFFFFTHLCSCIKFILFQISLWEYSNYYGIKPFFAVILACFTLLGYVTLP